MPGYGRWRYILRGIHKGELCGYRYSLDSRRRQPGAALRRMAAVAVRSPRYRIYAGGYLLPDCWFAAGGGWRTCLSDRPVAVPRLATLCRAAGKPGAAQGAACLQRRPGSAAASEI